MLYETVLCCVAFFVKYLAESCGLREKMCVCVRVRARARVCVCVGVGGFKAI